MQTLKSIINILLNNTGVTDIVGQRVFPNYIPEKQKQFPILVTFADDATIQTTMGGPSALAKQTVKVVAVARTYKEMVDTGVAVFSALIGKKGTFAGLKIAGVYYRGENESEASLSDMGENDLVHQKEMDFLVWYYIPSLMSA